MNKLTSYKLGVTYSQGQNTSSCWTRSCL